MQRALVLMFVFACGLHSAPASEAVERALQLERSGQPGEARALLARHVSEFPDDVESLLGYAEFLDRYQDPARWEAYEKTYTALESGGSAELKQRVSRRLGTIALTRGDLESARRYVDAYRAAGGGGLSDAGAVLEPSPAEAQASDGWVTIPGPLLPFQRMAALSRDQSLDELMPALSRNLVTSGYRATQGVDTLQQTEYLKLILQYLSQARELAQFAGADEVLDVPDCESRETAQLLKVLGFRLRNECGPDAVLETVNPSRAFLSIDSGFPLADLEEAYRRGEEFRYPYEAASVPIVFGRSYWQQAFRNQGEGEFIEQFLNDPAVARMYLAMSRLHPPTAQLLREKIPIEGLRNYANVYDFFGGMFEVRDGKAVVPGGEAAERVWRELVGVAPSNPAEFFHKLASSDDGWMAAYFDALARLDGPALRYFTDPRRAERYYAAVRGRVTSPGPARPIFRSNTELLMLTAGFEFNSDGNPHVPGGIEPWQKLFTEHPHGKYDGKLTKSAAGWSATDDVIEAMFALTRKAIENEPLKMFLAATNVDRIRTERLSTEMVRRLILAYPGYGAQFNLFAEAPTLSEQTMTAFLDLMPRLERMRNLLRRSDAVGMFQGLTGLWRILYRQGQIDDARADTSLREIIAAFDDVSGNQKLFDAGREGVRALLAATGSSQGVPPQDRLIELLAGKPGPNEDGAHQRMVERITTFFDQQRLVSITTIFDLADHLERVSRGEEFNVAMANRLAASISEVRLPRSTLSTVEANSFAQGEWVERHIQQQRGLNLRREVDRAGGRPDALLEIRGELTGILRDSLVGLNYVYYSPPGAELIRANPLFVRSHNFLGYDTKRAWSSGRVQGSGWPSSGGGRILGSLSNLPYSLAEAEQNFMIPSERQALIWQDLAPQILIGATVPRWWRVSPSEMHFVGLHLRLGRELVAEAAADSETRGTVFETLRRRVEPARLWEVDRLFGAGDVQEALDVITPAELYELSRALLESGDPVIDRLGGPFVSEIRRLASEDGVGYERIASVFGTPHPELMNSYRSDLLHLPLFPTMMGYSSRIMAESWESTNLYWAALADELHMPPAELNLLVPEWTQRALERIFATHLEDWPALWRSMRIVGDRYRQQLSSTESTTVAALGAGQE